MDEEEQEVDVVDLGLVRYKIAFFRVSVLLFALVHITVVRLHFWLSGAVFPVPVYCPTPWTKLLRVLVV